MEKLRGCPHCLHDYSVKVISDDSKDDYKYYVECEVCLARSPHCSDEETAVASWNNTLNLIARGCEQIASMFSDEGNVNLIICAGEELSKRLKQRRKQKSEHE